MSSEHSNQTDDTATDGTEHEIGIVCDVDVCDNRIVGLDDGWEFSRGTVCQDCIDFNGRHRHWPDEETQGCRQCVLDDGGEVHDCSEVSCDVLLRPGDECPECDHELPVTDGGLKHWQECAMPECTNDVPKAKGICDECTGVGGESA